MNILVFRGQIFCWVDHKKAIKFNWQPWYMRSYHNGSSDFDNHYDIFLDIITQGLTLPSFTPIKSIVQELLSFQVDRT